MTKGPGDTERTLSEKISYLEEVEQGLVNKYRSVDVFGSVEAFYDAKARLALFGRDSNSAEALEMLPLVLLRFRNAYFASVQLRQMARLNACLADGYVSIFILDEPDLVILKINNVAPSLC